MIAKFDRFELDLAREELLLDGVATAIQPQPLKALVLLVSHAGKLVSREQIQDHLWPDAASTDVERSLNHTIRKLRQVLEDDARRPRFIQTVARRGYRFIGRLAKTDVGRTMGGMDRLSSVDLLNSKSDKPGSASEPTVRLRISSFQEVTDDRAWPQLSEGVVEELTTMLVGLRDSGLAVLDDSFRGDSRSGEPSSRFFGLKGCVRRSGAKVRVNAHLAQLPEGALVATTAFEQELGNVFDLQGVASRRIIEDLILPLLRAQSNPL